MAKKTRLSTAQQYKKQIARLNKERDKVYTKAIKELKLIDDDWAFDYFHDNIEGQTEKWYEEDHLSD
jgi:hypothetical protein